MISKQRRNYKITYLQEKENNTLTIKSLKFSEKIHKIQTKCSEA
jgi:hypothetical protein